MSPASKSKSKKVGKEPAKSSSKPSVLVNTSNGVPASGYNPLLGTFHTFETPPVPSASPVNANGRFRNIDDVEDQNGNSNGTGIEYDSVSNNGSWSGESEDHKEKPSQPLRQESVPGADLDKREKIRQKNEKKHQRQKERRAQELHEKCSGYLMSRKLEALAQQLVAMGFTLERATMALILNEGRVEESVAWLFEAGEDDKRVEHNLDGGGNLKIDISEELAKITEMEMRYKASKQEVERAIVNCEGDLEKAEEILKTQKLDPPATPPKPEATGDPPAVANNKLSSTVNQNTMRTQVQSKPNSPAVILQRNDERDFNYTKVPATVGPRLDHGTKGTQPLKKIPPKMEWAKPQPIMGITPAEKRWLDAGSNPSVSYSLSSSMQASPPLSKMEAQYLAVGNELKNLQLGSMREPIKVMQRPQSINSNQVPSSCVSSSPPGMAMSWHPSNVVDRVTPNGPVRPVSVSRSLSPNGVTPNPLYSQQQLHYQSHQQLSSSNSTDSQGLARGNSLWNRGGASPTLSAASSLGLFSGLGTNNSSGSSSPVDWSTGSASALQFDYTSIDWSLDRGSLTSKPNGGLLTGTNMNMNFSVQRNPSTRAYDSFVYGVAVKPGVRAVVSNGNAAPVPAGLHEGLVAPAESGSGATVPGSWEWTSPFEEKDLFSLPRQYVSSPSL